MLLLMGVQSLRQSPEQVADQFVGRYEYVIQSPSVVGQEATKVDESVKTALKSAGATESNIGYRSFDLRAADGRTLFCEENDWIRDPFPGRFTLNSGNWPKVPGEVVASAALGITAGESLTLRPGNVEVKVVGIAAADFARDSAFLAAASGTWRQLILSRTYAGFMPSATRDILWSGGAEDRMVDAVAAVLQQDPSLLRSGLWSRDALVTQKPNIGAEEWLLSILGPIASCIAAGSYLALFVRRLRAQLYVVGIPRSLTGSGIFPAAGIATALGSAAGASLGVALGLLGLRPLIDRFGDRAPGEVFALPSLAVVIVSASLVGTFVALAVIVTKQGGAPRHEHGRGDIHSCWLFSRSE